jgi:phosphate transport system substrate-binding protein
MTHHERKEMRISKRVKLLIASLATVLSVTAVPAHANVNLQGSGASFVGNVVDACKIGFNKKSGNSVAYNPAGSSTGVRNADANIGDFWFSDAAHLASTRRSSVINIPVVAAPIAVLHNLPARTQLYLSPETVAGIFAGQITKWNDPKIQADNNRSVTEVVYRKGKDGNVLKDKNGNNIILRTRTKNIRYTLPNKDIKVFYRSDGSGTTNNFTRYLNAVAPSIFTKPANNAFTTAFPGDLNAAGNRGRIVGASQSQGVALNAGQTKYSITYAEVSFAAPNNLKVAAIGNAAGNFVLPNSTSTSAFIGGSRIDATTGAVSFDYQTKEPGAYGLSIVSYLLFDTDPKDKARGKAVKEWAQYLLTEDCINGDAKNTGFIVLTGKVRDTVEGFISRIKL